MPQPENHLAKSVLNPEPHNHMGPPRDACRCPAHPDAGPRHETSHTSPRSPPGLPRSPPTCVSSCDPPPYRVHSTTPREGEERCQHRRHTNEPPSMSKEIRLLSTSAILGYGFPEASLKAGLARDPHVIGVDGGSVDPGPHYLGSGKPFCSPIAIRRDLRLMLRAAIEHKIPLMIGTCGGAGGAPHVELVVAMVREIACEDGLHFKMATIHAEQDKTELKRRVAAGTVRGLAHQAAPDRRHDRTSHSHRRHDGTRALHGRARCRRPGHPRRTCFGPGAMGRGRHTRAIAPRARLVRRQNAGMRRHTVNPERPRLAVRHRPRRSCRMRANQSRPTLHTVVDRQPLACMKTAVPFITSSQAACLIHPTAGSTPSAIAPCASAACAGTRPIVTRSSWRASSSLDIARSACAARAILC